MQFKSAVHPDVAKEFAEKTVSMKNLPEHAKKKRPIPQISPSKNN